MLHTLKIHPGVLLFTLLLTWPLSALASGPFYTRNLNPFVQVYGLPGVEGGEVAAPGALSVKLQTEMANSFTRSYLSDESILLDGESYYLTTVLRYGWRHNIEVGLDIPSVSHSGGIFDHFIEGWHETFGLPDGNRSARPRNQLEYSYSRNGNIEQIVDESSVGIGDIRLSCAYKFWASGSKDAVRSLAWRTTLKLPTGSAGQLRGSKSVDVATAIAGTDNTSLAALNISLHTMFGGLYMGSGEVLSSIRKDFVGFVSVGAGWRFWRRYQLRLQFDSHTPFYDSNLDELGAPAVQVVFGGDVQLSKTTSVDLSMVEDIIVDTSPDLVLRLGLQKRF